jgi:hypothetical protein
MVLGHLVGHNSFKRLWVDEEHIRPIDSDKRLFLGYLKKIPTYDKRKNRFRTC